MRVTSQNSTNTRLSCDRCRAQKLRCPRGGGSNDKSCSRCVHKGVECIYSTCLPKGRPRATNISGQQSPATTPNSLPPSYDFQVTAIKENAGVNNAGNSSGNSNNIEGLLIPEIFTADSSDAMLSRPSFTSLPDVFSQQDWNDFITAWSAQTPAALSREGNTVRIDSWSGRSAPEQDHRHHDKQQEAKQQQQQHSRHRHDSTAPAQLGETLDIDRSDSWLSHLPDPRKKNKIHPPTGYMVAQSALISRYVERSFWALVYGQELVCKTFMNATIHHPTMIKPWWYGDLNGFYKLLKQIPQKPACDLFLHSFLIGVHPIHPLIIISKFRKDYGDFWRWHTGSQTRELKPSDQFIDDPTFIPLLFSVLFCGAAAAPESFWSTAPPLAGLGIVSTVDHLRHCYLQGLEFCQHERYPNLNTLIAALLGHTFSYRGRHFLADVSFFDVIVRISQSMGLHLEHNTSKIDLDAHTLETYRRIWWHVVWLDNQYSLQYGSQTRCGTEGNHWNVRMIGDSDGPTVDESLQPDLSTRSLNLNQTSVFVLFGTGHYEIVRFMHALLSRLNSYHPLNQDDLNAQLEAFEELHMKINKLINKMPARGAPEKGFVPFRMSNASMLTDESLYSNQSDNPNVFISWGRIKLAMLMTGALLTLQKGFLGHPGLKSQSEKSLWTSSFRLSINYIRYLLQIARVPAFAPYFWFLRTNISTMQAIIIIFIYLRLNPSSPDARLALYLVDEVFEFLDIMNPKHTGLPSSEENMVDDSSSSAASSEEEPLATWSALKAMRIKLGAIHEEHKPHTPHDVHNLFNNNRPASGPSSFHTESSMLFSNTNSSCSQTSDTISGRSLNNDITREIGYFPYLGTKQISGVNGGATDDSSYEPGLSLDISDLETWSSIVLRNLEAFD